jgi:hypothetical protein
MAGNPPGRDGPNMGGPEFPAPTWVYSPDTNAWTAGPDFPTQQAWGGAHSLGGSNLIAISGAHGVEGSAEILFDPRTWRLNQ